MIREVYIDNQLIDIESENEVGYIFESPIFRDIAKILSNRTTTYKIPKTSKNLAIVGLADNADVLSDFPYVEHSFREYRDGLLLMKGVCTLLEAGDNSLEFSVIWGNTINLLSLKDLELRELKGNQFVDWNEDSKFLLSNSENQYGFIVTDFGRGLDDIQYIHPSITVQGILDIITSSQGVNFKYPERFTEVFNKTWIPLLEKNASQVVWDDYNVIANCIGSYSTIDVHSQTIQLNANYLDLESFGANKHDVIRDKHIYVTFECNLVCSYTIKFHSESPRLENGRLMDCYLDFQVSGNEGMDPIRISPSEDGAYHGSCIYSVDSLTENIYLKPRLSYVDKKGNKYSIDDLVIEAFELVIMPYPETVKFLEKYPIIANLPDLKVVDFLKELMQLYGLFTYYDYSLTDDSIVEFISINDMYDYKKYALDWSDKLVNTTKGKFNITYTYSDYAQNNVFKYADDDSVNTNADGVLTIANATIQDKKDLVQLNFAPSDNIAVSVLEDTDQQNIYAKIKLYDEDGNTNSLKDRLLTQDVYKIDDKNKYISAKFDEKQKFSGETGLLKEYYSKFQLVLNRPIVATTYVYLKDFELTQFKEKYPVFINGVYYMPISVTVQTNGLATCKLIKMPYEEE